MSSVRGIEDRRFAASCHKLSAWTLERHHTMVGLPARCVACELPCRAGRTKIEYKFGGQNKPRLKFGVVRLTTP
jgi:hypothetical protein